MEIQTAREFIRSVKHDNPGGGYEMLYVTNDGGVICQKCAWLERKCIVDSIHTQCDDGWRVVVKGTTMDVEPDSITCDHCGNTL